MNSQNAGSILGEAHESLRRKISDFTSIEEMVRSLICFVLQYSQHKFLLISHTSNSTQIVQYETALLDLQAYERKHREASEAREKAEGTSGVTLKAALKAAKVEKIKGKLDNSKEKYQELKNSLWSAFEWYHNAGGKLLRGLTLAVLSPSPSFLPSFLPSFFVS